MVQMGNETKVVHGTGDYESDMPHTKTINGIRG